MYCQDLLSTIYKGSDAKEKINRELTALKREEAILTWIIDDNLPF